MGHQYIIKIVKCHIAVEMAGRVSNRPASRISISNPQYLLPQGQLHRADPILAAITNRQTVETQAALVLHCEASDEGSGHSTKR